MALPSPTLSRGWIGQKPRFPFCFTQCESRLPSKPGMTSSRKPSWLAAACHLSWNFPSLWWEIGMSFAFCGPSESVPIWNQCPVLLLIMLYSLALADKHGLLNKNLSVIHETHPVRYWLRCLQRFPPNNQTITAALGWPPLLDDKTLLLKTPRTLMAVHTEVNF